MTVRALFITDASGSMHRLASDVRGGYNSYLDKVTGESPEVRVTSTVFNTEVRILDEDVAVGAATRFDDHTYDPHGATALLDAIGNTVKRLRRDVAFMPGDQTLLFIQTDGHENASVEWDRAGVAKLLAEVEAEGWSVIYSGVGPDGWAEKASLGRQFGTYSPASAQGVASTYQGYEVVTRSAAGGQTLNSGVANKMSQEVIDATPGASEPDVQP
jgi:hypothetical protein